MQAEEERYVVMPTWQPVGNLQISADIHHQPAEQSWLVTMMLSFAEDPGLVWGDDMTTLLFDERGTEMQVRKRPTGRLEELAEELRIAVDAPFEFEDTGHAPAQLQFTYGGQTVQFAVVRRSDKP